MTKLGLLVRCAWQGTQDGDEHGGCCSIRLARERWQNLVTDGCRRRMKALVFSLVTVR